MTIGIALLGAGVMGHEHVARIDQLAECELHSVIDPTTAGRQLAARRGVPCYPNLERLWQSPLPDAAIIATPNNLHVEQAIALLRRGVPVLIEKPVAQDVESGTRLVEVIRQTGIPALVGHHRRHSAALTLAKATVSAGELGRLVAVNTTLLFHKPAAYFEVPWRSQAGGGPIMINLVHEIDALRFLVGDIVSVQAQSSHAVRQHAVEDTAAVILQFANGVLGTLLLSDTAAAVRSWEQTSGENPAYAHDSSQDCLFLAGTQGSLAIPTMTCWQADGPASWNTAMRCKRLEMPTVDPLTQQLRHFCAVVTGQAAPLVTVADALSSLQSTLAVHEAVRTGRAVNVPTGSSR